MKSILHLLLLAILVFFTLFDSRAQYCASNATSAADSKMERLVLTGNTITINNSSLGVCNGYTNYTAIPPADLTQGNNYTVSITHGTCGGNYTRWSNAWIDWNNDNDFLDAGEMLGAGTRLEKEWKVTRTNHAGSFNMDILLSPCGAPASVATSDLRLLVDDDGNFSNGGTQCYYNGDGSGLVLSYANPYITVSNISAAMIPDNSIKYITIASINVATPLPVELLQFDAQLNASKRSVDLTWSTETEHNSDYFEVQKLISNQWAVLDVLAAQGESDIIRNYYTVDFNPAFGVNYYRLKQVDKNGGFAYSDIRAVALNPGSELIIFPNPAQLSVQLIQKDISREKITLIDQAGRTVHVPTLVLSDDTIQLNIQNLANGIYLIRIGAEAVVQKLAIQH